MLEFLDNYCLENGLPHPFQSIYSLQAVCDRCPEKKYTGSAQITLVLAHLVDNYNNNTKKTKKTKKQNIWLTTTSPGTSTRHILR